MSDGFIGALASVLISYPRQVALQIANPLNGIASEIKFISIADAVAWLERKTEPLRQSAAREERIAEQLAARDEWQRVEKSPSLLAKAKAWLDRTDPAAKAMFGVSDAAEKQRKEELTEKIMEANRRAFIRECERDGIDPKRGVSPALVKLVQEQRAQ